MKKKTWDRNTYIIRMPGNTCHRGIMYFPDKFTDPPVKRET